ncbi:hypothetical protein GC194_01490 [bacterium]|nr:hypothetical protein [bacterium]
MKSLYQISALLLLLSTAGCHSGMVGDEHENLPPETYSVVKEINRTGEERFVSQIEIQWWGDDPDGVVKGYEFSIDNQTWHFTKKQDSLFLVNLPEGADTFDFAFYVRAVDFYDLADPTPAKVVYPVKNSPPQISFDKPIGTSSSPGRWPKKTFPVLQFKWLLSDPDGFDNIDHIDFFINDTSATPIPIDKAYTSLTLKADQPESPLSDCSILLGSTLKPLGQLVSGLKTNAHNVFYLRAVDKVGASSAFVATDSIYVKRKVSDVLLVNAYNSAIEQRENFFTENLLAAGVQNFDTMRVNEVDGEYYTQLAVDNTTQSMIFGMFKAMIWFGEDAPYTLTLAQRSCGEFLNNGGKLFVSVFFSSSIDPLSTYLDFTPIDSLVDPQGAVFFMDKKAEATPQIAGWPVISAPKIITSTRPFYPSFGVEPLYKAKLKTAAGDWNGESVIMAKKDNNGQVQFIISSIELYRLDGENNMPELFTKIFKEEMGLN